MKLISNCDSVIRSHFLKCEVKIIKYYILPTLYCFKLIVYKVQIIAIGTHVIESFFCWVFIVLHAKVHDTNSGHDEEGKTFCITRRSHHSGTGKLKLASTLLYAPFYVALA